MISVISNIVPRAVAEMVRAALASEWEEAARFEAALRPLFALVTVRVDEQTRHGPVQFRARNPLPIKTMMGILGMPGGPCRRPLGRMTRRSITVVLNVLREVWKNSPEILRPIEGAFDVSIERRLSQNDWSSLTYDEY